MTKFIPAIAAALLATAIATPVFAQAAIQEPGAFAFYHPNADVLAGRYAVRPPASANAYAYYGSPVPAPDRLPVTPRHRRTVR
ncbi:hypothetical protein KIP88_00055 [Bradyrhizobium sp. SRL28]|uniref:hypothetical protein n=1 Tax=Bradyrhizobium sp. SRL28 TaxID=2836178 RepID=UPI001BDE21BA|nr:hypothetical protein [Bradyrhizobium sp. SRL28]MBT1508875.1 hypothetical protein [Bradyrhizobium sp. SRL28]